MNSLLIKELDALKCDLLTLEGLSQSFTVANAITSWLSCTGSGETQGQAALGNSRAGSPEVAA